MAYKRIVVKVGSNVLAANGGGLDITRINTIAAQIKSLSDSGIEVILVSSGAVAAGRGKIKLNDKFDTVASRQVWASVGQVKLIEAYSLAFEKEGKYCAQILVTKEDFRDRTHYLNLRNCFQSLLQSGIIPVVNENDAISVTELMFTDNDELSGLIASMLNADALIILSNVDGIFDKSPSEPGAKLISEVSTGNQDLSKYISATKSNFGRGGMITKSGIARKVAKTGIHVHIANGTIDDILSKLVLEKSSLGTHFVPAEKQNSSKNWVAYSSGFAKGSIKVNKGAEQALLGEKATSILPIGVLSTSGDFETGDLIAIYNENEVQLGIGKTAYSSKKLPEVIGRKNQKAVVHYDFLHLFD
jgi:glutamate 5-kinase